MEDGELGFYQPIIVSIVDDMGALKLVKETHKGAMCDPCNVSDFDCSISDEDNVNESEEPIKTLCPKEMDEFCNAKCATECEFSELIVSHKDTHDNNIIKGIRVDEGLTSLGEILSRHDVEEAGTRQCASADPNQICLIVMPAEEVMSDSLNLVSTNESDVVCKKSTEDSKNDSICRVIADNADESSIVNNKSTEESKIGNICNANTKESHIVSKKSTEESKRDNLCNAEMEKSQKNDLTHGESSFSMEGPLSGLITYSGPIAYSGSCSLRSDSSATSTRSFAFPVLQVEWNNSPVRMRAADRRKHSSWRQGLLCCRF